MKTTMIIVALLMSSTSVFASKARVKSLQGAFTTQVDIQDSLMEPAKLWANGDFATFELGMTSTTWGGTLAAPVAANNTPNAEGGISRTFGNSRMSLYLGNQSESISGITEASASVQAALGYSTSFTSNKAYTRLENPFQFSYAVKGDKMTWGAALYYASSEAKIGATQNKKTAQGIKASLLGSNWNAYANIGLAGQIDAKAAGAAGADKAGLKMKSAMKFGGQYDMENLTVAGFMSMGGGKIQSAADTEIADLDGSEQYVGVESGKKEKDGAFFFYGAGMHMMSAKSKTGAGSKVEVSELPVYLGIEADATSWLALRGSLKQPLLMASMKANAAGTDAADTSLADATTVAAGGSIKLNKINLDFVMAATGNGGKLGVNDFGTDASLTYMF